MKVPGKRERRVSIVSFAEGRGWSCIEEFQEE